eukprot:m.290607 g.290607  ORF g.290607 m.290607 type:complete len:222 (-) comp22950_c20_seq1:68-733(-)
MSTPRMANAVSSTPFNGSGNSNISQQPVVQTSLRTTGRPAPPLYSLVENRRRRRSSSSNSSIASTQSDSTASGIRARAAALSLFLEKSPESTTGAPETDGTARTAPAEDTGAPLFRPLRERSSSIHSRCSLSSWSRERSSSSGSSNNNKSSQDKAEKAGKAPKVKDTKKEGSAVDKSDSESKTSKKRKDESKTNDTKAKVTTPQKEDKADKKTKKSKKSKE